MLTEDDIVEVEEVMEVERYMTEVAVEVQQIITSDGEDSQGGYGDELGHCWDEEGHGWGENGGRIRIGWS